MQQELAEYGPGLGSCLILQSGLLPLNTSHLLAVALKNLQNVSRNSGHP
jgi:hypothetical protein